MENKEKPTLDDKKQAKLSPEKRAQLKEKTTFTVIGGAVLLYLAYPIAIGEHQFDSQITAWLVWAGMVFTLWLTFWAPKSWHK